MTSGLYDLCKRNLVTQAEDDDLLLIRTPGNRHFDEISFLDFSSSLNISSRAFSWSFGRNGNNQPNQFLRREGNVVTNLSPWIAPYDCSIYTTAVSNQGNSIGAEWTLEIRADGVSVHTVVKTGGILEIIDTTIVNLNEGDRIDVAMVNQLQTVNRPFGTLYLRER